MFSILAAKKKKCIVYNIDINPVASKLCTENIKMNKLAGQVISINADAEDTIRERLQDISDRTLMLLPERSDEFLRSAISTTKHEGMIHYYSHIHADKKSDAGMLSKEHYCVEVSRIAKTKTKTTTTTRITNAKIVRPVGPRYYQTVVDAQIFKD